MKHIITTTLLLVLALLLPTHALAHDFMVDGIYYNINGNEATVTYRGNYHYSYDEYYGDITIPVTVTYNGNTYSVTKIGREAFQGCHRLTSIEIPNSVTSILSAAFYDCSGLTSVNIPNSVTSIGEYVFRQCSSLVSVEIPNSVTLISYGLFYGCSNLTSIEIPNSITRIANNAFANCIRLSSIIIPNSVTTINDNAFYGCENLISIEFPNSFISYGSVGGNNVFTGTAWYDNQPDGVVYAGKIAYKYKGTMPARTTIAINEGTLGIANSAFKDCEGLTNVIIPNSVISIGADSFMQTGLTSIEIPNSVISIDSYAFANCKNIVSSFLSLPESVKSIGNGSFSSVPFTHISIEGDIDYMGEAAFGDEFNYDIFDLQQLALFGNIKNGFEEQAFWHYYYEVQRYIDQLIIGVKVDSIKGMNIEPGSVIYSYNPVPPIADENTFLSYGSTVHVPATSLAAYFTAPYWCNFANIVGDAVEPQEVTISEDSVEMQLGSEPIQLSATVSPANTNPNNITWESSNVFIATVYNGQVYAVGAGECDIIAHCLNKKAICHVVVNDTTVTITLDQQEAMLLPNHMLTLTPSAPAMPSGFTATSSDPTVAAVRMMNGKVQIVGIKEGTTTITVASTDGTAQPATCLVTVYTEPCDVNCDGFITIGDATQMIDYLLSGTVDNFKVANADVNGDGNVSIGDVTALIDQLLSSNN